MKVVKKKEIVSEEIDVQSGTYYFECHEGASHKIVLDDYENVQEIEYYLESVENYRSPFGIRVRTDIIYDGEEFPYKFSAFIRGISGKEITKEEFKKEKQEVLEKLNNGK